jgi:hypothetical protein
MFQSMRMRCATLVVVVLAIAARFPLPQVCSGPRCHRAADRATMPPCCATTTAIPIPAAEGVAEWRVRRVVKSPRPSFAAARHLLPAGEGFGEQPQRSTYYAPLATIQLRI